MKTKIWILVFCIFLQGCHSYKLIDASKNEILMGKKYKIMTKNMKRQVVTIYKVNDTISGIVGSRERIEIPVTEIIEVKKRKFSTLKTVGLSLGTIVGVSGLYFLIDPIKFNFDGFTIAEEKSH